MKQGIITLCFLLLVTGLWAQNDRGAKVVTVSQAFQEKMVGPIKYTIQVGLPYLVKNKELTIDDAEAKPYTLGIRFPWDVLYLYDTFSKVDGDFEISKGYFGDKILISWNIKSNSSLITTLKIYRRKYNGITVPEIAWTEADFIKNISKTETEYEDKYVEGGVLYEYKLVADGVSKTESLLSTYITGIGFRNPTAVVTGNVSYDSGSPVKDVVVVAKSDGAITSFGSALKIPSTGRLEIKKTKGVITNEATLQAWLKPGAAYTDDNGASIRLFSLENAVDSKSIDVNVKLWAASNILEVNIGGSIYKLHNYYPSGTLNNKGDDVLLKVADFNSSFVHFSVVIKDNKVPSLFINGRVISQEFRDTTHDNLVDIDVDYKSPYFTVDLPNETDVILLPASVNAKWDNIYAGGGEVAILDELRVWKSALDTINIRTDYRRYISGNNSNLISYLSANEGIGDYAYDYSRNGFNYNKNNALLVENSWVTGEVNTPTPNQLGILGITNENGNYQISSIPYSGLGESFTITPLYGKHKFELPQQLVYLGLGSEVVNKIDFKDKSSFIFKGKVLYDSRGVFPAYPNPVSASSIIDEGYNVYDLDGIPKNKGQYWVNEGTKVNDKSDDTLEEYSTIYVEGVNIYIDGVIVKDENNVSKITLEKDGNFEISVPIGKHYITVKKDGHVFEYEGRFPQSSTDPEYNLENFFENRENRVVFIDKTRKTLVGRVVGGAVQAQKAIGFGEDGLLKQVITDVDGNSETVEVSSKNNIGVANITLGYKPPIGGVIPTTKFSFVTNITSGEFREEILPLRYELLPGDISIGSNTDITFETSTPYDYSKVADPVTPEYKFTNDEVIYGTPYDFYLPLIYRSAPSVAVIEQTSDKEVVVVDENGKEVLVSTNQFTTPIYTQFENYVIVMEAFEEYSNKDVLPIVPDKVPIVDGDYQIDNQLALPNSEERMNVDESGKSQIYKFKGGIPKTQDDFTKTLTINFLIGGQKYEPSTYNKFGIILGGASNGTVAPLTKAPDVVDFILRDPPGSNSFASIEKGSSISITEQLSSMGGGSLSNSEKILTGMLTQTGGGLAGPVIKTQMINDTKSASTYSLSSTNATNLTKTYTFNQTISTSSDPEFVGSEGDLYIGKSKNYFFGTYHKIAAGLNPIGASIPLTNSDGKTIHISKQVGKSMTEDPVETTFMYSQKFILETLIPELQGFIDGIANGSIKKDAVGILDPEEYKEQIRQWQLVIEGNERSKYQALYNRTAYKATIKSNLEAQINQYDILPDLDALDALGSAGEVVEMVPSWIWGMVSFAVNKGKTGGGSLISAVKDVLVVLKEKKNELQNTLDFYDKEFQKNISFDAGLGEYHDSSEINIVSTKTKNISLKMDSGFTKNTGGSSNGIGAIVSQTLRSTSEKAFSLSQGESNTSVITYTLKDNDRNNFLSVDVVNSFDGNGPIFSTLGGRTSCPYEGDEKTNYYNNNEFNRVYESKKAEFLLNGRVYWAFFLDNMNLVDDDSEYASTIDNLAISAALETVYSGNEKINVGTQQVEIPGISVVVANVDNLPASRAAEFDLELVNNSVVEAGADFLLKVNLDNLQGAEINIEQNGTIVHVPYGKVVHYKMTLKKVAADAYDYEDIKVSLRSICEEEKTFDEISLSAHFVPECTEVAVSAPVSNWLYNIEESTNGDGSRKPLKIAINGFSTAFSSFQKIVLEYRLATSPNWTRLQSYYGTDAFLQQARLGGEESNNQLIKDPSLYFSMDIVDLKLEDGDYEIRARSVCTNKTEYITDVITGRVDLHSPQKFGTPLPIDGILGAGEDLKVSFNENISFNSASSKIVVLGETNQLLVNDNVSLRFEGNSNTAVINNPKITSGDLTLEFWMNNGTDAAMASIVKQEGGLNIGLDNGEISFTLGGVTAKGSIFNDKLFHHYTFSHKNSTGEISIYEDSKEIVKVTTNGNMPFTNNNALVIGGNTFIGNMHNLRLWNKTISLENASAKMYDKLIGNEPNLIGYWPMDEGRGGVAKDLARYKHAIVNTTWDIFPKGASYDFANGQYLDLNNTSFVVLKKEMDATISFWMKTGISQDATLFSNGKGDGTDEIKGDGFANKWAINMASTGKLTLESEGNSYELTSQNMADDIWHHVTILFNRIGSLRTYVDAEPVSSNQIANIAGFYGDNIWLGARGSQDAGGFTIDRKFSGKIDEFRLWNTLRNVEQISRDRFNEVDFQSIGLLLYSRMNKPETFKEEGPRYYHMFANKKVISSIAEISGAVKYSNDVPPIKPVRSTTEFDVNYVINKDEMIFEIAVEDMASLEGKVVDITVARMYDDAENEQGSPITWTAYIKRNEVSWFAEGYNEIVDIVKNSGTEKSFEITLLNKGGKGQPFNISNVPSWLKLSKTSGTVNPDSKIVITARIDKELTAGEYLENIYLQTDFGYDEKLQIKLRVLAPEPNWVVDPTLYKYSMNLVGRIKVDGTFSEDNYDKIAAFSNGEVRGSVNLVYNQAYQEYFAFLTVYSNSNVAENIEFKIWDSSQGKVIVANVNANSSIPFEENGILGKLSLPVVFENSDLVEQEITFNKGWTWVSMNVVDANFSDLNKLTAGLSFETDDRILSHSPARLETYYKDGFNPSNSTWSGGISTEGGLTDTKMYKVFTTHQQPLIIEGAVVDVSNWSFPIQTNWNWLPYSLLGNQLTNEALAYFDATDGDVIKSQNLFAIYDPIIGWNGTLNYLESGKGYMIKSTKDQTFKYPNYLSKFGKVNTGKEFNSVTDLGQETIRREFMQYADNMNAVVSLPKGYNELFAYDVNGVLKGAAVNQYVNNETLTFITVYGEIPETLVFYIGDGINKKRSSKTFSFKGNDVLGTIMKPVVIEEIIDYVTIYPNPFDNEISIKVNAVKDQIVSIQLYSLMGQIVLDRKQNVVSGENVLKIQPRVASGSYLLQIEINGEKIINKVMKN